MAEHNALGKKGETIAIAYLRERGYEILHTNWRYQKSEIDIIAREAQELVVVEVKTRSSDNVERPKEAVTPSKQKRIVKAADAYIQENKIDLECRFDIVSIIIKEGETEVEHIKDAFYPTL